jgi:hypothetical protein
MDVAVEQVVSGPPIGEFTLRASCVPPADRSGLAAGTVKPWNAQVGASYLFFVVRGDNGGPYKLATDQFRQESVFELEGDTSAATARMGGKPLCEIVALLAPLLYSSDFSSKYWAIGRLGQLGADTYFPGKAQPGSKAPRMTASEKAELRAAIDMMVKPGLLAAANDSSSPLQSDALFSCAEMQLPEALGAIVAVANGNGPDADVSAGALAQYPPDVALPRLMHVLLSAPEQSARLEAATHIQYIGDERTLPGLLRALPTADLQTSFRILKTLEECANGANPPPSTMPLTDDMKQKCVVYWQGWAATHKAELAYLSHSFDTDPHASDRGRHEQPASP